MNRIGAMIGVGALAVLLVGCGSGEGGDEGSGAAVKQLPASAPVTSEAQQAAQAAVANDPKAEKPRADGQ